MRLREGAKKKLHHVPHARSARTEDLRPIGRLRGSRHITPRIAEARIETVTACAVGRSYITPRYDGPAGAVAGGLGTDTAQQTAQYHINHRSSSGDWRYRSRPWHQRPGPGHRATWGSLRHESLSTAHTHIHTYNTYILLLHPPRKVMFSLALVCLFVCYFQVHAETTPPIFTKFGGKVAHGTSKKTLRFRGNHVTLGIGCMGLG